MRGRSVAQDDGEGEGRHRRRRGTLAHHVRDPRATGITDSLRTESKYCGAPSVRAEQIQTEGATKGPNFHSWRAPPYPARNYVARLLRGS